MPMHEFEDLVEMAVKRLARSGLSRHRLRSLYFNLFELEGRFDTSFTHFRTLDELLAARYVYCLAPSEHPAFASDRAYFEGLSAFCFVDPPHAAPGHEGGYFKAPYLYCDAGSPLWERLVELGRLGGRDAERPETLPSQQVLEQVARAAEDAGDVVLVAYAYRLLLWDLLDREVAELEEDLSVQRLRDIARRTGALDLQFHVGALRDPTPADLEDSELVRFWFDLREKSPSTRRASGSRLSAVRASALRRAK